MDFTFNVTGEEANLLIRALGELPAKISMGLIGKLQQQVQQQIQVNQHMVAEQVVTE